MSDLTPYPSANAAEAGIKVAARKAAQTTASLTVNEWIVAEHFNRFLSRVFANADDSSWILKGGVAMLARIPQARTTLDIDLYRPKNDLDESLEELIRLAKTDLGDHFRFIYRDHRSTLATDSQSYTEGYRVTFDVYVGTRQHSPLKIDLTVGAPTIGKVITVVPKHRLDLPRLTSHSYRVYPLVDQIADKVCATIALYNGKPSSREKDLIDLVIIATTQCVELDELRNAIRAESRRRGLVPMSRFQIPTGWGSVYKKLATSIPTCADYPTATAAQAVIRSFIEPALDEGPAGRWDPDTLSWEVRESS